MTHEEKEQWHELYEYVRTEILKYPNTKALSKTLVLRLKGLKDGKFMANKHTKSFGTYGYDVILLTFKICKFDIIAGLTGKEFKNETHKVNYIMAIVESRINDTVDMINRKKVSEEKGKIVVINVDSEKAEYKKKTKEIKSNKLDNLW